MSKSLSTLSALPGISSAKTSPIARSLRRRNPQTPCGDLMRQSSGKSRQVSRIDSDATVRLLAFLRAAHPDKPIDHVFARLEAVGAGVSRAAVAKWFERASAPSFSAYCGLIAAYGPRLLACVLGPGFGWLDEAASIESRKMFAGQVERLKKEFGL